MLIAITCRECGFAFKVDARFAGRRGICPNPGCRNAYVVPQPAISSKRRGRPAEGTRQRQPAAPAAPKKRADQSPLRVRSANHRTAAPATVRPRRFAPRRKTVVGIGATAVLAFLFVAFVGAHGDRGRDRAVALAAVDRPASADAYVIDGIGWKTHVKPFLQKYCIDCHGPDLAMEGIALHKYADAKAAVADRTTWEKVAPMLEADAMPPGDHDPRPSRDEVAPIVRWIDGVALAVDCTRIDDPGRVTIRRLNRAEYDNTIRDLVGVDFHPAEDFPSDDVGAGFDNIGDVLSLPPLLLEKYLRAAEEITERAIDANASKPAHAKWQGKRLRASDGVSLAGDGMYHLNSRGEVFADFDFPAKGKYLIRAEASADQAGPEPAKMELRLDGKPLQTVAVEGEHKRKVYETRAEIPRGRARLAAAFINDYYNPDAKKPTERDRNLQIGFLEVKALSPPDPASLPQTHRRIVFARPKNKGDVRDAATRILWKFATRAFRRPVTDEEIERFVRLVEMVVGQGDTFERGIQVAIQGILVSPHFLFRVERDRNPNDPAAAHHIGDYELASRLSYFLWSTMPDDELFSLAERGRLHERPVLEKQVRRMLADAKANALVENFAGQWLNLRNLALASPDPKQFADFDDALRADMRRETEAFFAHVLRDDRPVTELLDGKYTFVNARLAEFYGLPGVQGDQFRKVSLEGQPRAGVLTQASILTLTSNPTRTSPVKRGKWILENILGAPPPPPPADVPALEKVETADPNASLRTKLELHRKDPACATCHAKMDPLGFGFENFDAIGRWREKEGKTQIDPSGTLPSGERFQGPLELVRILGKRKTAFCRCLTEKLLTYALGRELKYYDTCAVASIVQSAESDGYRFSTLVTDIVTSRPFLMRRGDDKGDE